MEFSEKLINARQQLDITQETLCAKFDIPRRTLQDWEAGIKEPPIYVQNLLLKELNIMIHSIDFRVTYRGAGTIDVLIYDKQMSKIFLVKIENDGVIFAESEFAHLYPDETLTIDECINADIQKINEEIFPCILSYGEIISIKKELKEVYLSFVK